MSNLKSIIEDSAIQYGGAVLQNRALIDVRDGLKPSARQIFYSMLQNKLTHDKPHKKTMNAVGKAMADYYIHGDSSAEGIIMRAGQEFAMRYPLVEVKGNAGTLISSGSWAAPRYTESRLSKISERLFGGLEKETITEWRDNYDNTKQYPSVLPSKGFYNIVNGSQGIGFGLASSIPQFNLRELNKALEVLLVNPDCEFDDIYIAPDFATGATLLNANEVKESIKIGRGNSCKLRSAVEFDSKERCFIVTEIPYGVYTNTICKQLEAIINDESNPGIERFNDLTGKTPLIKIYLTKKANPNKVLKLLYKETSLQSYFGINFTMLDHGRFPKVFTWREMLQAHIDHEKEVYRRGFEFDLRKITNRIHIIDGLLIVMARIEEVIQTIKTSASTSEARLRLCKDFLLDDEQAKAVLDMKLSRLARLEVKKLEDEKEKLLLQKEEIESILNNKEKFNQQLINGWREVAQKFGDARRTKVLDINEETETTEQKELIVNLSNQNNIYLNPVSTLYSQRRGGTGSKFKMSKGEHLISTTSGTNLDSILFFTDKGNYYGAEISNLPFEEIIPIESLVSLQENEQVKQITFLKDKEFIVFCTANGIIKKSKLSEYNVGRRSGAKALNLDSGDIVSDIIFMNEEPIGMLTARGQFVMCKTKEIRPIGRIARGVKGITLNDGDTVVAAGAIPEGTSHLITLTKQGYIKKTPLTEVPLTGRATKGTKIHSLKESTDELVDFQPLTNESEIVVMATNSQIKFRETEISSTNKGGVGIKSIKILTKTIGLLVF